MHSMRIEIVVQASLPLFATGIEGMIHPDDWHLIAE
jgi:hypothetical protein